MSNLIYDGHVSVYDKKADGSLLIIGKGDRQGEQYYKISFKVNGEYVNLMDFQGITGGQAGDYHVEYYQKFDPKTGQPDLYNGKPQYNLESIVGGAQTALPAPASTQAAPSTQRDIDIRRAVALKAATEEVSALVPAITASLEVASFDIVGRILEDADRLYRWLETGTDGKTEEPPAGFDDKPEPDGDEDIPF